jgi:hypothetical protein
VKDLFGAERPDPPPMDAPLPFVCWKITRRVAPTDPVEEPEYWMARTESEAREAFAAGTDYRVPDAVEELAESTLRNFLLRTFNDRGRVVREPIAYIIQHFGPINGPCCIWAEDMEWVP